VRDYLAALDRVAPSRAAAARGPGRAAPAARPLSAAEISRLQAELRRPAAPRINPQVGPPEPHSANWPEATRGLRLFGARRTRVVAEVQRQMDGGAWPPRGACLLPALFPAAARNELCPDSRKAPGEITMTPPPATAPADPYANFGRGAARAAPLFDQTDSRRPVHARPELAPQAGQRRARGWVETQHATAAYNKDANHYASMKSSRTASTATWSRCRRSTPGSIRWSSD
jgi:hypothetical protein